MKFTRLRLTGFKSFVEPTELHIEPGLTAVIGPNGCGKSNLFDAMRWVMGETRPTSVRGSEMDDVIFAGSAGRPARNVAEVTIFVDNADRSAPAPYNEYETIEVSRRIEREAGSVYRINGRDVRQRDVQIFFADASSGAGSTAFVRQGQIGLLISQKPLARRAILEEAAGIGGLHQRRHEAELRLKAAETNMSRLDDVIREVEGNLASLKRQARAAARYRNLSGDIRRAEALAHFLRWAAASAARQTAEAELEAAVAQVAEATALAATASTIQAEAANALSPLRQAEAERGAALQRLIAAREALEAEEKRAQEAAQRIRQFITQSTNDRAREETQGGEAGNALAALEAEERDIHESAANEGEKLAHAQDEVQALNAALAEAEKSLEAATGAHAEWNARTSSNTRTRDNARASKGSSIAHLERTQASHAEALEKASASDAVREAEARAEEARAASEAAHDAVGAAREILAQAERAENEARGPLEDAERAAQMLASEAKALGDLLHPGGEGLFPPLVDAVTVQGGYEAALAAALGDDLRAPLDEAAPSHWRDLGGMEPLTLPGDVKPLSDFVKAPPALARRLSQTGIVFPDQGAILQKQLKPGQRLVSPRGDMWRWDGFSASADAPSQSAVRLAQRNRLTAVETEHAEARETRGALFAVYSAAKDATATARQAAREAEEADRRAGSALMAAQGEVTRATRAAAEYVSRLANLEAEIRRLTDARDASAQAEAEADAALAQLGDGVALAQAVNDARSEAADARGRASEARAALDVLRREGEVRTRRLNAIGAERKRWSELQAAAQRHIAELDRRLEELAAELATAEAVPAAIEEKRVALLSAISEADAARKDAADARASAENHLAEADKAAKAADAALSASREARARLEAMNEAAAARIDELQTRIRDELDCAPDELAARAEINEGAELPPLEQAEKRAEKLKHDREQLGGVNLRAEEEAQEQETRLATLVTDRDDLSGAIERLRRGIQSLNKEGRERLLESFEKVNANFQELFTKLFQGGEAKLTFTESDDPLEAGLEIFARPPGKRLQNLTLLSGGEQALTAMALIFAVFLVNPAPVCVLDEVDAPLDDANVDRFCNLLDEMTRMANTRFLVITHHALTMSRMNRLFGVTMAERGVSQLVSVSLKEAEKIAAE